jgi:hypothetical protein
MEVIEKAWEGQSMQIPVDQAPYHHAVYNRGLPPGVVCEALSQLVVPRNLLLPHRMRKTGLSRFSRHVEPDEVLLKSRQQSPKMKR